VAGIDGRARAYAATVFALSDRADMKIVLETPRLILRELAIADVDFIAPMLMHPEVMRYWPRPYTHEECDAWIANQQQRYARDGYGYWLALDKATGEAIGQAGLVRQEVAGVAEAGLGYIIHHPYWRRGLATEAASASVNYAFEIGNRRVVALIRPENTPSRGVAKRLGMQLEGRTEHAGFEHLIYSISRSEQ
jgi:RimJ/RimL family protein N-acetyltransferase